MTAPHNRTGPVRYERTRSIPAALRYVRDGEWWHVGNRLEPGSVTLAADGRVTGYAGIPTCHDCGHPTIPAPKETP